MPRISRVSGIPETWKFVCEMEPRALRGSCLGLESCCRRFPISAFHNSALPLRVLVHSWCNLWLPRPARHSGCDGFHLTLVGFVFRPPNRLESRNSAAETFIQMKFSELVRLLEQNGFRLIKEKGSIRYYGKPGVDRLVRVDYHGSKEVPTGTCNAILKAAGLK